MRTREAIAIAIVSLAVSACGATTISTTQATTTATTPAVSAMPLTSAAISFTTPYDVRGADSDIAIELLEDHDELSAETTVTGARLDASGTPPRLLLGITGPFRMNDIENGALRVRMIPGGHDAWTLLDVRLVLSFGDGTSSTFFWPSITVNGDNPERKLALAPAHVP